MEIRNALQKIENYLTVVSNLNRTILSEGTMSRDELLLMKKYLYTSIDRIEDIERALTMESQDEQSFEPNENIVAETVQPSLPQPEIVQVASSKEEAVLPVVTDTEAALEQIEEMVEETPLMAVQQEAEEVEQEIVAEEVPESAGQFAQDIITEDFVVDEITEESAEEIPSVLAATSEETPEVEIVMPVVDMPLVAQEPAAAPMVAVVEEKVETPVFAHLAAQKSASLADELVVSKKEETTLLNKFEQQPQPQLFQLFDDGKEELHETFTAPSSNAFELPKSAGTPAFTAYEQENETVLVAEKEEHPTPAPALTPSSLNEVFKPQTLMENVNSKMSKTLSESIALNDKFIFVRELFGNQFAEYENGLKQLDALTSYETAEQYCQQYFWNKYNWDAKASAVERFKQLLQKKFN